MSTSTTTGMITSVSLTQSSPALLDASYPEHPHDEQPLSLSFLSLKDERAYEHDRQRQKQARDFAQMRARKGRDYSSLSLRKVGWLPIPSYFGYRTPTSASEVKLGLGNDTDVHAEDWVEHGFGSPYTEVQPRSFGYRKEAKLADLTVSVRKPGKHRETDFEFIPHTRSVIVLDDIVQTKDVSVVDEPWEHVGGDEKAGELTYANVVANSGPGSPL